MGLFKKSKKKSDCCNIQLEEVKTEQKKTQSPCCDFETEEIPQKELSKEKSETKCCE